MLKVTKKKKENDTDRHMFASELFRKLEADYIALKVLIFLDSVYLVETILPKQIELKVFIFHSWLKSLFTQSRVAWANGELFRQAITNNNPCIDAYKEYCNQLNEEQKALNEKSKTAPNSA